MFVNAAQLIFTILGDKYYNKDLQNKKHSRDKIANIYLHYVYIVTSIVLLI